MAERRGGRERRWSRHDRELRDPHQIVSQWADAAALDPELLRHRVRGAFWEALADTQSTLLVSREYEHLLVALTVERRRPLVSYLRLPHPSGIAVDDARARVHVASTRNPNALFELAPSRGLVPRAGMRTAASAGLLVPVGCRYLPGCLYLHDLALVGRKLHGNAVGLNAVVELPDAGGFRPVWWPRSIDGRPSPRFDRNYLQLNSIAAGRTLGESCFSASAAAPSRRRPGHLDFPVDGRGVVFSGKTREPFVAGLTRPHSARFRRGEVWVDNSGYGELGRVSEAGYEPLVRLEGWTRGLCFAGGIAFVGTSRVIPRFHRYAPGLDHGRSEAGVHAIDVGSGRVLGSLLWPNGNQIFAVERIDARLTSGFPFAVGERPAPGRIRDFFFRAFHDASPHPAASPERRKKSIRPSSLAAGAPSIGSSSERSRAAPSRKPRRST